MQAPADALDIVDGEVVRKDNPGGPSISLGKIAAALSNTSKPLGAPRSRPFGGGLVPRRPPGLSLRQPSRGGEGRPVDRRREGRALCHRLRHRPRHQSDAGERPDCRRLRAGLGGALYEEFNYNAQRRSAGGDLRRLSAAHGARGARPRNPAHRGPSVPLNPLGIKGAGESGVNGVGGAIASAIETPSAFPAPSPSCR